MSKKDFGKGDKKKVEDVSVDEVYKEFLETFEDVKKPSSMAWVRGDVVNAEKLEHDKSSTKDRLYKPKSKLEELAASFQSTQDVRSRKPSESTKRDVEEAKKAAVLKKEADKKRTSNLENLKEELKRSQEERAERRRLREQVERLKNDDPDRKTRFDPIQPEQISLISAAALRSSGDDFLNLSGSYDADPTTTNIYIQNVDGKVTESVLCDIFGKFGPLASVKIMWPRTEEERARGKNAAFVAFMNRPDAERAIAVLQNRVLNGIPFRLGWGKVVPIPPLPIYCPPKLSELMQPQAPTGLPFNCSLPNPVETKQAAGLTDPEALQKTLEKAVVRVVVPTERALLHIVHRMVEFVCREGPMFEAMIMQREINNPMFRFLFDNKNPVHIYYRWKLFSILQGDTPRKWRTEDFRMFAGGSVWRPPPLSPFTQSMPINLLPKEEELPPLADGSERSISPSTSQNGKDRDRHSPDDHSPSSRHRDRSRDRERGSKSSDRDRNALSDRQRQHIEEMLRDLTAERRKIADAMVWCLDHAQSAEEVVDCILESLSIVQTPLSKKIARLYLVSDLLHNASAKAVHAFAYRKCLQAKLIQMFGDLNVAYESVDSRMKKEQFKTRVMSCFRAWESWAVFPNDFLIYLQNVFFGLVKLKEDSRSEEEDIEGEPINLGASGDDQLDGEPILTEQTAGLLTSLYGTPVSSKSQAEVPEKRCKVAPHSSPKPPSASKFQKSKWEEVDPQQVEAQAVTTSRWDFFEDPQPQLQQQQAQKPQNNDEDLDGEEIHEEEEEDVDGAPIEDSAALLARMRAVAAARTMASQLQQSVSPGQSRLSSTGSASGMTSDNNNSEERRVLLREIELQVMEYQDELESGQRPRESGISIAQQVQRYREQLVAQASNSTLARNRDNGKSKQESRKSTGVSRRRSRSSSRSPSRRSKTSRRSRSRSRSRSPSRKSSKKY